ncbi:DUF5677 domain-containing protein [Heyndrickxia oleronia]|uniref:DUF5677 domain-containing protein n=1 Tax=Heyndrickxia oleronia TaxID=38875 RepID=A0AAW6SUW5_9BACI|nr:DUF5677 domain-containing protein [Heyndrickxia oleronia]MDH5160354.1 DUF5677 domain-containing protein [Heyndrickxia oleronia]
MNEISEVKAIEDLDKLINEFIRRGKVFVEYSCYLPGLKDHREGHRTIRHVYDHEYLAFTKSLKTLISIKKLLEIGNNEDTYILLRSIFENYLAARYLNVNVYDESDLPKLDEYIANRINITLGYYSINRRNIMNEEGEQVGKLRSIKSQLVGLDSLYYDELYGFLSRFSHLDFSNLDYYINRRASFVIEKESDSILCRLVIVFVMTKIFECIVTIEGEDFYDEQEKIRCYSIVMESLITQRRIFDEYIDELNNEVNSDGENRHRVKLRRMLKNMNISLEDSIGDIEKDSLF